MGEVPEGRRGTPSKRFVPSPSDPIGPPPPYDGGGMIPRLACESDRRRGGSDSPSDNPTLMRRAVLAREDVLAVGAGLALHVDLRIVDLVERRAVADHQKHRVLGRGVDEAVGVAAAGGEAGAHAGLQRLAALVGLEHDLARDDPDEFVLPGVRMARRGLRARYDAREVHAEIIQANTIAQPAVPAPAVVGAKLLRIGGGVALGEVDRIEGGETGLGHDATLACGALQEERNVLMPGQY